MVRSRTPKFDASEVITNEIIRIIERGVLPWRKPWTAGGSSRPLRVGGEPYQGVNNFLLTMRTVMAGHSSPFWMTLPQANALDAKVRKGEKGVVNLTRWRRGNGLFWSVRCSRRPSKRRRLRFDDSVLRLRNGGWRELRNGFGRQCGRLQTVATRPESEILACNALVFETVDGCFPPCCSSPCGNDVRDRMRLHVWPLRRIAACL